MGTGPIRVLTAALRIVALDIVSNDAKPTQCTTLRMQPPIHRELMQTCMWPTVIAAGAVLFGQQPGSFSARRCRLSYGFDSASLWNEQHAEHSLSHGYPKMVVRTDDGKLLASKWAQAWRGAVP